MKTWGIGQQRWISITKSGITKSLLPLWSDFVRGKRSTQINPTLSFLRGTITCVFTLALFSRFYFILLFRFGLFFCFQFWFFFCCSFFVCFFVLFFDPVTWFSTLLYLTWCYMYLALWPLNVPCVKIQKTLLLRCVRVRNLYCSDYKWFSREFLKHATARTRASTGYKH